MNYNILPITAWNQYYLAADATQGNIAYTQTVTTHTRKTQAENEN